MSSALSQSLPLHWLTWLGLGLLRLAVLLPQSLRWWLGRQLGGLLYFLAKRRTHITDINMGLAFPEWDDRQRHQQVRDHINSQAMSFIELGMSWWLSDRQIDKLVHINGIENLHKAQQRGHGVILLSAHFGALDLSVRALGQKQVFDFTYRPHQNPIVDSLLRKGRERHGKHHIPKDNIRDLLKALKDNRIVWYASDQNFGHKNSVFVDFFGVAAATNTGISRIAKLSKAAVVPYFYRRNPDGKGYHIEIQAELTHFPSGDAKKDAQRINHIIEDAVRKAPEQYYWSHRRYKDRPDNQERFY